jgi:prolyl-tRNA synthetase
MVLASGGSFSKYSHEFQTFSEAGEDLIFRTSDGIYHNREIAPAKIGTLNNVEETKPYEEVRGEGIIGVQALLQHLDIPIEKSTKTLIYNTETGEVVIAALRSDYDVNELKLCEAVGCKSLSFADNEVVKKLTGAEVGYAGIVNLPEKIRVFLDDSLEGLYNFETGANKTGYHAINVNFGRDVKLSGQLYDFKNAKEGDLDPKTNQPMESKKAIEVGNIFSLGTKFSAPFDLTVTDREGKLRTLIMGCYGLGVSRVMGTIAEKFADDKGLVWPEAVAPAKVYIARLGDSPDTVKQADELYDHLTKTPGGVLYDDRDMRPGAKFADADLLGIPYRVVVSDKTAAAGTFELKARTSEESRQVNFGELLKLLGTTG